MKTEHISQTFVSVIRGIEDQLDNGKVVQKELAVTFYQQIKVVLKNGSFCDSNNI